MAVHSRVRLPPRLNQGRSATLLKSRFLHRWCVQGRTLPAGGVPHGAAQGALPYKDIPSEYRCVPSGPHRRERGTESSGVLDVDKLGRICLDILKGARTWLWVSRRPPNCILSSCDYRQVVSSAPDTNRPALHPSPPQLPEPRRPPRDRRREALQGEREGCTARKPGMDGEVRVSLDCPEEIEVACDML